MIKKALGLLGLGASLVVGQNYTATDDFNITTTTPVPTTSGLPCWWGAFPTPPPNYTNPRSENDLTCDLCTLVFQGLDDVLLDNEYQIAHALENLCEGFPWLFEICWRLVEYCTDDIIEMIIEYGLNPKDMCDALFLCPSI